MRFSNRRGSGTRPISNWKLCFVTVWECDRVPFSFGARMQIRAVERFSAVWRSPLGAGL